MSAYWTRIALMVSSRTTRTHTYWTRIALMVSSRTTRTHKVESISWQLPEKDGGEFHIEFSERLLNTERLLNLWTFCVRYLATEKTLFVLKDPLSPLDNWMSTRLSSRRRWYPKYWQQFSLKMTQPPRVANQCVLFLRIVRMLVPNSSRVHAQWSCSILRSQNRQIRKAHFVSSFHQIWEASTGITSFWGTIHGCSAGFRCQWTKYCDLDSGVWR